MRDAAIVEIGVREIATHCALAELAYERIDRAGAQPVMDTYGAIYALLFHAATVARLLSSPALAEPAQGRQLSQVISVPQADKLEDYAVRSAIDHYDQHLARGLALRGAIGRLLDMNIGDRDAFEAENVVFLRHYDPTVDTLTLLEEEFQLGQVLAAVATIRSRAESWLAENGSLQTEPATISLPPTR